MVFRVFSTFLIFDPNWPFSKAYSPCMGCRLCKTADFFNCLISRLFGVFSRGFLHKTCSCRIVFRMFLAFLIFDLNWPFRKGCLAFAWAIYSLCSEKLSHFSKLWCFFERFFFAQKKINVIVKWFFACFCHF